MNIRILHNPRCSKSRAALALLQQHGVEPEVVRYMDTAPTAAELDTLLHALGMQPRELMRHNETLYADLDLDDANLGREALIRAMTEHPVLIQRPIVIRGDKAVIGRPPDAVLDIL